MPNYIQLKNQIEKLQKEAEIQLRRERAETLANIKQAIAIYEFTVEDLGFLGTIHSRKNQKSGRKTSETASSAKPLSQTARETNAKTSLRERKTGVKSGPKSSGMDKRNVVAPKYRDVASGATWAGRGKQPKWLSAAIRDGKKLEDYKI